jgi:hypothetical protein
MNDIEQSQPKDEWYSERIDSDNGVIHYEAHGPKDAYTRFEGANAKLHCELFMGAITGQLNEEIAKKLWEGLCKAAK